MKLFLNLHFFLKIKSSSEDNNKEEVVVTDDDDVDEQFIEYELTAEDDQEDSNVQDSVIDQPHPAATTGWAKSQPLFLSWKKLCRLVSIKDVIYLVKTISSLLGNFI